MLVLQGLEQMYWLTLILTLKNNTTVSIAGARYTCSHRYTNMRERFDIPSCSVIGIESHVITSNVAAAAASTQYPHLQNKKDKVADLLHPGEMWNCCWVFTFSCCSVAYCSLTGNASSQHFMWWKWPCSSFSGSHQYNSFHGWCFHSQWH